MGAFAILRMRRGLMLGLLRSEHGLKISGSMKELVGRTRAVEEDMGVEKGTMSIEGTILMYRS
jgi:hypothetical protein